MGCALSNVAKAPERERAIEEHKGAAREQGGVAGEHERAVREQGGYRGSTWPKRALAGEHCGGIVYLKLEDTIHIYIAFICRIIQTATKLCFPEHTPVLSP